ncbi:hypothetical protein [Microbacterium sp. NPDC055665]
MAAALALGLGGLVMFFIARRRKHEDEVQEEAVS